MIPMIHDQQIRTNSYCLKCRETKYSLSLLKDMLLVGEKIVTGIYADTSELGKNQPELNHNYS